ncbi:ATP-dependent helicase [Emcibacter sp.]|uniref:ATP-dependent helicase n=1 Tax=Emcibacter sp. TaxID=1979954 RepID=UPI003A902DCA
MSDPFDLDDLPDEFSASNAPAQPAGPPPYMDGLNGPQLEAVEAMDGPVLVLAGAGTGKTRVLTTRLAHILATGRAYPGQILCVTFTNKAAQEMKMRVGRIIGEAVEGMFWLGTFHSIGVKILRRHADLLGLESNFTILDTDDQLRLLKQLIEGGNIDHKRWPPRLLASLIDGWKNRGLTPDKVPAGEGHNYADGRGIELYKAYQARLRQINACDFGDLLLHCLTLFQKHPEVLADYQRRFKYIMVDEYQDTNVSQYLWLRLLAQGHKNICCVGDDDQSIYGWRGAEVGNILRFEEDFPGAKVIRLEQNYRSTRHILGAAGGLIAANADRLGKTLWTEVDGGEPVTVNPVWDGREEARAIGEAIEDLQRKGHALREIAILVRAGFQTREFEERFLTLGIPYRIVGGLRFYERQEIRDAMAYLRVIAQPQDDLAFERIINTPKRGLGAATVNVLHGLARAQGTSLVKASREVIESDELRPAARKSLAALIAEFDRWRDLATTENHVELLETVLEDSGYRAMWQNDKSPEAPGKLENLSELSRGMGEFDSLDEFLEHISLVMENEQNASADKVSLMTLHAAKGLEFDCVFLPGWEEELFPSKKSLEESGHKGLEEERRLAYVGLTRARKQAHVYHASSRYLFGNYSSPIPSRFIAELPDEHVEMRSQTGFYHQNTRQQSFDANEDFGRGYGGSHNWSGQEKYAKESGSGNYQLDRSKARKSANSYGSPKSPKSSASAPSAFKLGDRVFHDKFGYGNVVAIDGNKLEIDFEKGSRRKVMESFLSST